MKKKIILGIVGVLILFGIIGAMGGNDDKTTNQTATTNTNNEAKPAPEPEKITARQLADDFDENQVAAKDKWKDKLVEFSAEISNITDTGIAFHNVSSKQYSFTQISCRVKDKQQLLPLKNGQTATVRGSVGGQTVGVIEVNNCEIVQ